MSGSNPADHVVPEIPMRRLMFLDTQIPIVEGNMPPPTRPILNQVISVLLEGDLGECKVIQQADKKSGQGYLLEINSDRFGHSLIKYLENRREIVDEMQEYQNMGVSPKVLLTLFTNRRWVEQIKNKGREIAFASQLAHPNIMKILAFISPSRRPEDINAIIIEGASHGTLEKYSIKDNRQLSTATIKKYALQLAEALRYCHEKMCIIHREVRPRNIYVCDGDNIKLGNFGYARINDEKNMTANKGDEIYYKAPEMIYKGATTSYSYPVDVYSYGLTIWSISHLGRKPFWDDNKHLCAHPLLFREYLEAGNRPDIREDLDPVVAELIRSCWVTETDLVERPTMSIVIGKLQQSQEQ